jgi:hypothetical protein
VNDDFVYMYVGEAMQAKPAKASRAPLLSQQINPPSEFADVYRHVAKRLTPAFVRFTATWSQRGQLWQRPCADPGD